MSTIDEMFETMNDSSGELNDACFIDPTTRVITVPSMYEELGVVSDEKVNRIQFVCPKIVGDNVDLTNYNLYINYQNAAGELNAYLIDDVTVLEVTQGNMIAFSWLLSRHVTEAAGTVSYIVCAKKSDGTNTTNEWNTKVAKGTVVANDIEPVKEIEEQNADVIEQILTSIDTLRTDVRNSISLGMTTAQVGQIAMVKTVDNTGKPISWEGYDSEYSSYHINNTKYGIKNDGSDSEATTNGLQSALDYAVEYGYRDVYLDAGTYAINCTNSITVYNGSTYCGVRIPSGIHLHLSPNTILKAQANGLTGYAMIYFCDAADAGIYGGKLYGDRDSHNYSTSGTHESGHVIAVRISSYIKIKDVQIYESTGDCITIGSLYSNGDTGYLRPHHITVDNCILDGARRNNISLIDGEFVFITNNIIQNAGTVNGTAPKSGIDLEPNYASSDENWQRAENVFIFNNTFIGNSANDLILHGGRTTKIVAENNIFKCTAITICSVLLHCNKDVRICNNLFTADSSGKNAIQTTVIPDTYEYRKNNIRINSNQLVNMSLHINGDEFDVSDNTIISGDIEALKFRNSTISNNIITSGRIRVIETLENSVTFTKNITICGNRINDYNPTNKNGAITINQSSIGTGLLGIVIKNNTIVDSCIGISAASTAGNIIVDSNAIYSTVDETDTTNYKSVGFAIDIGGFSDVVCTNNTIHKTGKIIAYAAKTNTKSLNIVNNTAIAGNATQAIKITGIKSDGTIIPFSAMFAKNSIKSLSSQNTFILLTNLDGCKIFNNIIDSQSTYRPIHSASSINTTLINNISNAAFYIGETDSEQGTMIV